MQLTHTFFIFVTMGLSTGIMLWAFTMAGIANSSLANKPAWRIGVTAFLLIAYAASVFPAITGLYAETRFQGVRYVAPVIAAIIIINTVLFASGGYRKIVASIPVHWVVGAHVLRVIPGLVFLFLADTGLVPPLMGILAGYGDIIAAVVAPAVAYLLYTQRAGAWQAALAWNIFGLVDLINALAMGLMTLQGWFTMLAEAGQSTAFVVPFFTLPTFPVPLWIVTHLWVFYSLRQSRRAPLHQAAPVREDG